MAAGRVAPPVDELAASTGPAPVDVPSAPTTGPDAPTGPDTPVGDGPVGDAPTGPDAPVAPADAPPPPERFRLGNRPPLTGIRALALFTVLTYHSNFRTLPGTWVALQVFFVLSGFLITAMLSSEGRRHGRVSLKGFYSRRAVRLLPPLVLTIALMGIYAGLVNVADASQRIWGDSAAAMFYYADYRQAFGHAPFFGFLAQTWSLSVEEQFYVIWSVVMVAAVAMRRRSAAYGLAVAGIVLSIADRLWIVYRSAHPTTAEFTRAYYAFDSRADALFLGCLLGLLASDGYLQHWARWAVRWLTVAAAASAVFLVWILLEAPLFTDNLLVWWLPTTTVASAVLIAYFVISPRSLGSKFVGLGILVFIGDLSYTVYLVHFPVYLAINPNGTHWSFWPTELVRLAVIFAIACFSWFCIEKPLAAWRKRSAAR